MTRGSGSDVYIVDSTSEVVQGHPGGGVSGD